MPPLPWEEDEEPEGNTREELRELLNLQRALLISVATDGPRIETVEDEYEHRRRKLRRGLAKFDLEYPFPWGSLWQWYGTWSSGEYPTWASRRTYISDLAQPVLDALHEDEPEVVDFGEAPPTWGDLDARLSELKERVSSARSLDDYQDVGRRCREIIRDAAALAYHPDFVPEGEESPADQDVKARLDVVFNAQLQGSSRQGLRRVMRSLYELANTVAHSDSIGLLDAFACAQATVMLVRVLGEIDREATVAPSDRQPVDDLPWLADPPPTSDPEELLEPREPSPFEPEGGYGDDVPPPEEPPPDDDEYWSEVWREQVFDQDF
jgi:hypothetical protein